VFLLDRSGGEPQKLTDVNGGVGGYEWSPDGKRLVLTVQDPDPDANRPPAADTARPRTLRERLMAPIEAERKVLVGFKIGDLYVDTFVYLQGERAGETGVSLKARLLRVLWAKVDGESVYRAPAPTESAAESD
jgi:hypothetical protein